MFDTWLKTGENYGEPLATEDFRQAIIEKILNSDSNTPILYYKNLGYMSHATIIGHLIHNKNYIADQYVAQNRQEAEEAGARTYEPSTEVTGEMSVDKNLPKFYTGNITPDENTIFVFGSNPEGRHGAGSAKVAVQQFGAVYGQGEGLQGNSYAIPTKDLRVKDNNSYRSISEKDIIESIRKMYEVAEQNPDKQFKVAYRNGLDEKTLNGYTGGELISMFKQAGPIPSNVYFSQEWISNWNSVDIVAQNVQEVEENDNMSIEDKLSQLGKNLRENQCK